jgi:Cu/Ag efflux pump CusA
MPLDEALVDAGAGAVRFRPMVLTAAAVMVGAGVILFDPIFQGLAVALIGGEVAATALSRVAVPVLYYLVRRNDRVAPADPIRSAPPRPPLGRLAEPLTLSPLAPAGR